ncbi:MAG TPA: CPBP family intramembrane glutamic endopeptidase [Blastocatellia bacterium]|nr:CPBP family intramembrane glutamic endopeptidase [Blastocatellia bacterium]
MSDPPGVARRIFMNEESELRCGWRVLAFVFVFVVAEMLLAGLIKVAGMLFPALSFISDQRISGEGLTARGVLVLFVNTARDLSAALIATIICAHGLEHRGLASVGFKVHRGWFKDFSLGSLIGGCSLAIAVGVSAVAGAVTFNVRAEDLGMLGLGLLITFGFFLAAGAFEELLFRGFAFQALTHNLGGAAAIGITAVFFGAAHIGNENASVFSTINTILAGVWLGLAYLITRSLWLATALHYSWNFAMVFVFGLPVSGFTNFSGVSWLQGHPGSPVWVSGGSYGPEAGMCATLALLVSAMVIWRRGFFNASAEMLEAIKHGKREPSYVSITSGAAEPSAIEQPSDDRPKM